MGRAIVFLLLGSLLFSTCSAGCNLSFKDDGTFTIMQVTDLHLGAVTSAGDDMDMEDVELVQGIIDDLKPDIVVLTGDIIEGSNEPDYIDENGKSRSNQTWVSAIYHKLAGTFEEEQQNWMWVIGNTEAQSNSQDPPEIQALDEAYNYSCTKEDMAAAYYPEDFDSNQLGLQPFNYRVDVAESSAVNATRFSLWALDTGSHWNGLYTSVTDYALKWFKEAVDKTTAENGYRMPGMAFVHIPTFDWLIAHNANKYYG
jgi:3',5'-cyclic AMP phosphodiesterase CpdA